MISEMAGKVRRDKRLFTAGDGPRLARACCLNGRTWHRTVGAKHAAVAGLRLQPRSAAGAYAQLQQRPYVIERKSEFARTSDEPKDTNVRCVVNAATGPARASCRQVRVIATHHLEEIRSKLDDLGKLERLLARTVARCSGSTAPECPVLDILDVRRPK